MGEGEGRGLVQEAQSWFLCLREVVMVMGRRRRRGSIVVILIHPSCGVTENDSKKQRLGQSFTEEENVFFCIGATWGQRSGMCWVVVAV